MMISVIYVAYRTPVELLQTSIDSIRTAASGAGEDVDVIVVDNGGAAGYASLLPGSRVIGNGDNAGFGHAVNAGVRIARGEFVLMMNPDSVASPDLFAEFGRARHNAANGTMFGALLVKRGRPQVHAYNLWWSSLGLAVKKRTWATQLDATVAAGHPSPVSRLCGAGWFAARKDLAALGPFDESFFLYGEDVDLSLRAKAAGHELLVVPRAVIEHDAGTSSEGASGLVERARTDAHLRLVARYRGYFPALLARAESLVVTLTGAALTRNPTARASRLARLAELRRWGLQQVAERFDPQRMR